MLIIFHIKYHNLCLASSMVSNVAIAASPYPYASKISDISLRKRKYTQTRSPTISARIPLTLTSYPSLASTSSPVCLMPSSAHPPLVRPDPSIMAQKRPATYGYVISDHVISTSGRQVGDARSGASRPGRPGRGPKPSSSLICSVSPSWLTGSPYASCTGICRTIS